MAAAIKSVHGIEAELVKGAGGVFEVDVDGKRIFSKKAEGRFPDDSELLDALKT